MPFWVKAILVCLLYYPIFVMSMMVYRAGRTMPARLEGNYTPIDMDPMPVLRSERVGMVYAPLITYFLNLIQGGVFMCGWLPTLFDPEISHSDPRRASRYSLAGPLALLSLVIWSTVLMRIGLWAGLFHMGFPLGFPVLPVAGNNLPLEIVALVLDLVWWQNLLFAGFYLLPIPPFDGWQVVGFFLPLQTARKWQSMFLPLQYQYMCLLLAMLVFTLVERYVVALALYLGGFPS
ncbi:MAG TPA: hypothetical protein VGO93_23760 [Candidatus Xenobia bacterium]|jgi:Zn-dependent protease